MKKILVTSKQKFPKMIQWVKSTGEPWAFISIESTDDLVKAKVVENNEHYLESGPNVLNLNFDDIDKVHTWGIVGSDEVRHAYPISEEQAEQIFRFAETHKEFNLLVHCYAGQSRSQGVARALWDIFPEVWAECKDNKLNPCLTPNMTVVSAIKHIYYKQIYEQWQ